MTGQGMVTDTGQLVLPLFVPDSNPCVSQIEPIYVLGHQAASAAPFLGVKDAEFLFSAR